MDRPTLEQLAQTTEPQMVRRRFDEHNLVWGYAVAWLFAVTSFALVPFAVGRPAMRALHIPAAIIDALLTLFMIVAMMQLRRARRGQTQSPRKIASIVGRNLSAWLIALFLTKFAVLEFFAIND